MQQLTYTLKFTTPAFLGNAEQQGQWRTPPIKALLRQWWRVAVAEQYRFDVDSIRSREAKLFGAAADAETSCKSKVRIRLDDWSLGGLDQVPHIGQVEQGKNRIPAALYAGYGPVESKRSELRLSMNPAIQAGAEAPLRIAFPDEFAAEMEQTLALMDAWGTLGGRSRNGWGSLALLSSSGSENQRAGKVKIPQRDWRAAMELDWPHALGRDQQGALIWQSRPKKRWEDAMNLLAQARADLRRAVPDRLLLAYPDTKGTISAWGKNARVPNSLRFKVREQGGGFVALIFHMPCHPAETLWQKLSTHKQQAMLNCFAQAHAFLDQQSAFTRVEEGI